MSLLKNRNTSLSVYAVKFVSQKNAKTDDKHTDIKLKSRLSLS